jgi:hypothetical protein
MQFTTQETYVPSGIAGLDLLKLHGYVWPTFPLAPKMLAAFQILRNTFYMSNVPMVYLHYHISTKRRYSSKVFFLFWTKKYLIMHASIQVSRICFFLCLNFVIQESIKDVFSLIWIICDCVNFFTVFTFAYCRFLILSPLFNETRI